MQKADIKSLTLSELTCSLTALGMEGYRAKQVFDWIHAKNVNSFAKFTNINSQQIRLLEDNFYITLLKISKTLVSSIDNTVKYLYELCDGECIETVLMDYHHGKSLCISTQAGCRMGCSFCASALNGLARSLTAAEMLEQVYASEANAGVRLSGIVLMGIGEPLDNMENVLRFLEIVSCDAGRNMSLRNITISTCGLVDRIAELKNRSMPITLSVSLHAPNDSIRQRLMPVAKKYSIESLIAECRDYFRHTGRRVSFEYALIGGVNDRECHASELADRLSGFVCHVNLININPIPEKGHKPGSNAALFKKTLTDRNISVTVRRTLGADINAACGQLRTMTMQNEECRMQNDEE
ncbi:MAG: 23S rRNA (adenine(2503)-C(2))-methyltransferase RlmN [Oscillospiraceae bacterium]|nr:23S rRNA (adenine(2503)-C(2))-methyltransferase RlmN [Oscillospiraceae bacterium]